MGVKKGLRFKCRREGMSKGQRRGVEGAQGGVLCRLRHPTTGTGAGSGERNFVLGGMEDGRFLTTGRGGA